MTTMKVVILSCNECGRTALPATLAVTDLIHMERPITSVVEARQHAISKGWLHDKHGRDLCPDCRSMKPPETHRKIRSLLHWGD